jgi:hypothetical protein
MPQQTVPSIDFDYFALGDIPALINKGEIFVNESYQRGDIWKPRQKIELIQSINLRYSIGVLVLFINEAGKYEILDGQQRLLTIKAYLDGQLDLSDSNITPYSELKSREKKLQDAYCVFYLKLKSHDPESKEEDIIQTFLRLQEGTPLNKAEKINAYRGVFKNTFKEVRETHPLFTYLGNEKRFRFRQLAAELLLLELEGDFENKIFPSLDINTMVSGVLKYERTISRKKLQFFKGNLDFMERSLNMLLGAFQFRDIISFYLLISYLRKHKAGNQNLINEYAQFAKIFLQKLNMFSIYDTDPPKDMTKKEFSIYKRYKEQSKVMTTSESFKDRLVIMLEEFNRLSPIILADKKRLHDIEQKRILFFRQQGICPECGKGLEFKTASAHHEIAHSSGGKTDDLTHAKLVHVSCHEKIEKRIKKQQLELVLK